MTETGIDPLAAVMNDAVGACGPMTRPQLFAELRRRGLSVSDDDFERVWFSEEIPLIVELGIDDPAVYVRSDHLVLGRIFTHRLTAREIDADSLSIDSDLEAVWWINDVPPFETVDGHLVEGELDDDVLLAALAPGALAGYRPGSLVGVRARSDGLHLEAVPAVPGPVPPELTAAIIGLFGAPGELGKPSRIGSVELIQHVLLHHPDLFVEPLPPISDIFEPFGLSLDAAFVAPIGFQYGESDDYLDDEDVEGDEDEHLDELREAFGLSEVEAVAVLTIQDELDLVHTADHPEPGAPSERGAIGDSMAGLVPAVLPMLANPAVVIALVVDYVDHDEHFAAVLLRWATNILPSAPRSAKASVSWLIGRCADLTNDVPAATASYERALAFDSHFYLALRDLAARVSEAGDAIRAMSLLNRTGIGPDDNLFAMVSRYVPRDRSDIGRNEPCWCGSGQKYKRCHAGKNSFTLDDRVDWLYFKIALWVQDGAGVPMMTELARIRSAYWSGEDAFDRAMVDPFVLDTTIFEGGHLNRYLELRGQLLPDDEAMLAAAWLTSWRSLYQVEKVDPGKGFILRDLRTGDRHEVSERAGSRQTKRGQLLSVRLLSGGGVPVIHGGIEPIPDHHRDAVLATLDLAVQDEADPYRSMVVLSARFAPPELRSVDGDEMVFCSATLQVPEEAVHTFTAALSKTYGAEGEPAVSWDWTEPADFGARVLGTVRFDADVDRWVVEAFTERRFDDLLATVIQMSDGIEAFDIERVSATAMAERNSASPVPPPKVNPEDPMLVEVLASFVAQREQQWVDEHIPSLGGVTPREAADDPTRRDELVRLLDSYDDYPASPGTMNTDNLRRALGLDRG